MKPTRPRKLLLIFTISAEQSVLLFRNSNQNQLVDLEKIVEIDESKFRKKKYNCSKQVDSFWIFGGIWKIVHRHGWQQICQTVSDRSAVILISIIRRWILPGTTILPNCWKACNSLSAEGYLHETVNHSVQFVSESGAHTNNIESRWNAVKKLLLKYGTNKELYTVKPLFLAALNFGV